MEKIKQQTKRRSQKSHEAIMKATLDLLEEKGYVKLTIEGIASRAGVGKQTIYRWWPSKAALVIEAYSQKISGRFKLPETGAVKGDLEEFLSTIFNSISQPPSSHVMTGLITEAQTNRDIADQFFNDFIQIRREILTEILQNGVDRGEIRPDLDLSVVVDMLFGPMWYRLLIGHAALDQTFAQTLVTNVLAGISTE